MPKPGTPRKTMTTDKPVTRKRRSNPALVSTPAGASPASTVTHEEIAGRAYMLFLARGGAHGDDLADWFQAEAELLQERSRT